MLRVAVAQYGPHVGDREYNLDCALSWTDRAIAQGAQLIVLPELASSGYVFHSEAEATEAAEDPKNGPTATALARVVERSGVTVVVGLMERDGDCRRNSALVLAPGGINAVYHKVHLFYDEQTWFRRGDELCVIDLPWGRLGLLICYDMWFPEAARALAIAGAEVIAVPTNWVGGFKDTVYDDLGRCQGNYLAMATAAQNGVVMACADRIGVERGVNFLGASIIVGADGWPVAGPASHDHEELLVADVDLEMVERARRRTPRNHLLEDRLEDAYRVHHLETPGEPAAR